MLVDGCLRGAHCYRAWVRLTIMERTVNALVVLVAYVTLCYLQPQVPLRGVSCGWKPRSNVQSLVCLFSAVSSRCAPFLEIYVF